MANSQIRQTLKSDLGKKLLTWFIIISIVPLIIISMIFYNISNNSLKNQIFDSLEQTTIRISEVIHHDFLNVLTDLSLLAQSERTSDILINLNSSYIQSGKSLKDFVKSYNYLAFEEQYCNDLKIFQQNKNFYDIFLIDREGNILFSVKKENDLGTNLYSGQYSNTLFAGAFKKSINSGQQSYSDLEFYEPSNNSPMGFVTDALISEEGNIVGIIAFQVDISSILKPLRTERRSSKIVDTFIIGEDLIIRTNFSDDKENGNLLETVNTEQSLTWKSDHLDTNNNAVDKAIIYKGRKGYSVLGIHHNLNILGVKMAVISEMKASDAFEITSLLKKYSITVLFVVLVIVCFVSITRSKKILIPILTISDWAKNISKGSISYEKVNSSFHELNVLSESFNKMVYTLENTANQANLIANGDFSVDVKLKSENDILGIALQKMISRLKNISEVSEKLANGDTSILLEEKNKNDSLAISINKMTGSLKQYIEDVEGLIAILDQISSPVLTVDEHFNTTYINPAGAGIVGRSPNNLRGKKCYDIFKTHDCQTKNCNIAKAMRTGKNYTSENIIDPDNLNIPVQYTGTPLKDKNGSIIGGIEFMNDITELNNLMKSNDLQLWETKGLAKINEVILGETDIKIISNKVCSFLADFLDLQILTFYIMKHGKLYMTGGYAYDQHKNIIELNEGIIGQAATDKKFVSILNIPEDYIKINSSLGETPPKHIIINPFIYNNNLLGIMEIGSIEEINEEKIQFLKRISDPLAQTIQSVFDQNKVQELLEKTQAQSEELLAQQEELRISNEELQEQTKSLKESQVKMEVQQEELRVTNEELEEKTNKINKTSRDLVKQKIVLVHQNDKLESASLMLEQKAKELEISSKYKSEFLANMSHELRTPLNSLLMLSKNMIKNKTKNLTGKQIKNAEIIYNSGFDLLKLINEILDLSKIESGKMNINIEKMDILFFKEQMIDLFEHMAKETEVNFSINIDEKSPASIYTDEQKFGQIIKNLLSNAFKFTEQGEVSIDIFNPKNNTDLSRSGLNPVDSIAFAVSDTGIGIPEDNQLLVFEAFQQVDGSISRKFTGTGLGLSISRELAKLIGGELQLESKEGEGSTFTLYVPKNVKVEELIEEGKLPDRRKHDISRPKIKIEKIDKEEDIQSEETQSLTHKDVHINDDRLDKSDNRDTILVIEDDMDVAQVLYDLCQTKKLKCLHAGNGEAGLLLVEEFQPKGIILDIKLPGMSGMQVLDKLKDNPETKHIPVHIMSGFNPNQNLIKKGAIGFLKKPITPINFDEVINQIVTTSEKIKTILVIENDKEICNEIRQIIGYENTKTIFAHSLEKSAGIIRKEKIDLIISGLSLPDESGLGILEKLKKINKNIPIIIYSDKKLSLNENEKLIKYANTTILKTVNSDERLLDEVSLFLHTAVTNKTDNATNTMKNILADYENLKGKTVLIVDDDMRNLYSLEEELREIHMNVLKATDGQMALEVMGKNKQIDLVLMDIMMPVMDGFEAMKKIRITPEISSVPIIAITAKAMKEDREECIKSGADDYLSKPIDIDKLIKLIKVWIRK